MIERNENRMPFMHKAPHFVTHHYGQCRVILLYSLFCKEAAYITQTHDFQIKKEPNLPFHQGLLSYNLTSNISDFHNNT